MAKILKTVRLHERYVNAIEIEGNGKNFTESLENWLQMYFDTNKELETEITKRNAILTNIDKQIAKRQEHLNELNNYLDIIGQITHWTATNHTKTESLKRTNNTLANLKHM